MRIKAACKDLQAAFACDAMVFKVYGWNEVCQSVSIRGYASEQA